MSGIPETLGVTRCVCQRMSFATLRQLALSHRWTLEDLIRETGCGVQCGLCRPYLARMMDTGQTAFPA